MGPAGRSIWSARERAALEELTEVALDLQGRATRDAPIEEGTLRGSAHTEIRLRPGGGAEAVVSFNTPYAARQHEELEWEHPQGGKARYLADNLVAMTPEYRRRLEAAAG